MGFGSNMPLTAAPVLLVLSVLTLLPWMATGVASTSKLQIHIPKSLTRPDGYDHRDALFGIPPYGGSISQQVYYAANTLCDANVDTTAGYPQRDDGSAWAAPFILMLDRGGCSFVQKVRNAQRAGAAAVLIADNTCLCLDTECMSKTGIDELTCEQQEPIMADDGSGSDISIPAFLLFKHDADDIIAVLKKNTQVRVEMSFSVPAPDARVEYDLWMTPSDVISRPFLKSFKEAAVALGDKAYFTPHMYIYDGKLAGCRAVDDEDKAYSECYSLCTNLGLYCATDPDEDLDAGVSGADVVRESLRRLCVWQLYGKDDGIGREWWRYVDEFMYRCDDPAKPGLFTNADCISDAMMHSGIEEAKVSSCMTESGSLEGEGTNDILEKELKDRANNGVVLIPSLFVNNAPVRGALSFSTTFRAICAGFAPGSAPDPCRKCALCPDEEDCVKNGVCAAGDYTMGSGTVSSSTFGGVLVAMTVLFVIFGYIQHRRQQQRMRAEVRGILAQYMPLDENKMNDTSVGIEDDTLAENEFTIT